MSAAFWLLAVLGCGGSAGPSPEQIARGEAIFVRGELTSGETMSAIVLGDVPMSGAQATCSSCHGRSGMGTTEQGDRTPSVAAPVLFEIDPQNKRPAYTDASLARAVRDGVDSAGRKLDPLMPHYPLGDVDMAALVAYLRTLGSERSPGIDDDHLRLATVVAGQVDPEARAQMVEVLEAFVSVKNAESRRESQRAYARREPERTFKPWREWSLDVWTLDGAPESWPEQLAARYDANPPFAMLSGLADGPWAPIHGFCESRRMPCILPNTDLPAGEPSDFYTLYFSGGAPLEARIVAADLDARKRPGAVVQVVGDAAFAKRAASVLEEQTGAGVIPLEDLSTALDDASNRAVVVWLTPAEWSRVGDLAVSSEASPLPDVYLSGTLWRDAGTPPSSPRVKLVQLFRRADESDAGLKRFQGWAALAGVEVVDRPRVQAQTWYAGMVVLKGAKHLQRYPFRDYMLDQMDHAAGIAAFMPLYPRGVFGPGQRRLAKGGYVLPGGQASEARWVVP